MAHFPTGVTIVTALGEAGPAGLAASAVTSLSLDPPLLVACLDRSSRTLETILAVGSFGVNLLPDGSEAIARSFARKVPMAEKWAGIDAHELRGVPAIDDAVVSIACELRDVFPGGDHEIVTGKVVAIEVADGDPAPLLFHAGRYGLGLSG